MREKLNMTMLSARQLGDHTSKSTEQVRNLKKSFALTYTLSYNFSSDP